MSQDADTLIALSALDGRIFALEDQIEAGPRQLATQQSALKKAEAAGVELHEQIKDLQRLVDHRELEMRQAEAEIEKLEGQLPSIKTNEEYQAMLRQIETRKNSIGDHEDRILQSMEVLDAARGKEPERNAEIDEKKAALKKREGELEQEIAELRGQKDALETEWNALGEKLSGNLFDTYRHRRVKMKARTVVRVTEAGHCGGCQTKLTAQNHSEVMGGSVITCPHCQRLLAGAG